MAEDNPEQYPIVGLQVVPDGMDGSSVLQQAIGDIIIGALQGAY